MSYVTEIQPLTGFTITNIHTKSKQFLFSSFFSFCVDRHADRRNIIMFDQHLVGCVAQLVQRRSLAGELTLFCARPSEDG